MEKSTRSTAVVKALEQKQEDKKASRPTNVSFADALANAREGKTIDMSPNVRPANKKKPSKVSDPTELLPIPAVITGEYWSRLNTFVSGRPKEQTIREMVKDFTINFVPVEGVPRDPMDPHYKAGGGKENLCTVVHTTRYVAQAPDAFNVVCQGNTAKDTASEINQVRAWCEEAKHYVVTNGPMIDCLRRWISAAGPVKVPGRLYTEEATVDAVAKMLPWDPNYVRDMVGKMPDFEWLKLNLKSSAGFPWDQPKREPKVLMAAYETAAEIFNGIRDGSVEKLIAKHPQWLLVKLMNKLDRYDMREVMAGLPSGVIRQYFVYGFHWIILFSAVVQNISQSMKGFWENPDSFSAHGFSWQNGGPQRLVDWVRHVAGLGPGIYGIAYSDDQLWVVVCKDGAVLILCPDIKRMDLSLVALVGKLFFEYGKRVLGVKADASWQAVLRLLCKMAFDVPVITEYGLVFQSKNHLHSGVPGTPEFDQVASAAGFFHLKKAVGEPDNAEDAKVRLEAAFKMWEARFGLRVKPYKFHEAKPLIAPESPSERYVTAWTFLGKHLMYDPEVGGWLPCSDPVRGLAAVLAPKSNQTGFAGARGQMQRVRQIVAAGLFAHPQVFRALTAWYEVRRDQGVKPADPFEPADQDLIDDAVDLELALQFKDEDMPTYVEIANIYLPEAKKIDTRVAAPGVKVKGETRGVMTAQSLVASLFSTDETVGSWADSGKDAPIAVDSDKGATNISALPTTSLAKTGRARPKTREEEIEYQRLRKIRFEERMARMFQGGISVYRSGKVSGGQRKGRQLLGAKAQGVARALAEEVTLAADTDSVDKPSANSVKSYYAELEQELDQYDDEAKEEEFYRDLEYETAIHVKAKYDKDNEY